MILKKEERISFFVSGGGSVMKFELLGDQADGDRADGDRADKDPWFEVDVMDLKRKADNVRQAVETLCALYVREDESCPSAYEERDAVERIAGYGSNLRTTIYSSEKAKGYAREIQRKKLQVTFYVNKSVAVHAPYGLIFGDVDDTRAVEDLADGELRAGFWNRRHGVSVVYSASDRKPLPEEYKSRPRPFTASATSVFGVFHHGCLQNARGQALPNRPKPTTSYSAREFKKQLKQNVKQHNVIYFFCHANGKMLSIGDTGDSQDDNLHPDDLDVTIKECGTVPKGGLIVLNGCRTAVFSKNSTWLRATRQGGFAGFIGTEATVPTLFAWKFGNDLLKKLLSEKLSPVQALKELREDHWPLSLLYGLYCLADVRVAPPVETDYLSSIRAVNHSHRAYRHVGQSTMASGRVGESGQRL